MRGRIKQSMPYLPLQIADTHSDPLLADSGFSMSSTTLRHRQGTQNHEFNHNPPLQFILARFGGHAHGGVRLPGIIIAVLLSLLPGPLRA